MKTGSCHFLSTALVTLIAGLAFFNSHTTLADELIPTVSSLNAPADVVFVDAGAVATCLKAARPGALCLSLDRVLKKYTPAAPAAKMAASNIPTLCRLHSSHADGVMATMGRARGGAGTRSA